MRDYIKRLLNQKDSRLNNSELQRSAIEGEAENVPAVHLKAVKALQAQGIDTSRGLEGLRLYPEHKDKILNVYFDIFPGLSAKEKLAIAEEIVNQRPEKRHLPQIKSLFESIEDGNAKASEIRWLIAQPLGKVLPDNYEQYRHYLEDFSPGSYRVHIAETLYKARDNVDAAYKLAIRLLDASDHETAYGALTSIDKMGLRSSDRKKVERLLSHPTQAVKTLAAKILKSRP